MKKLKIPYNCSSVDFEQRDKINEIINELENIDLDLKALFQFKENVEDAKKVDDLIKINTFVDKKINEKDCYICKQFNIDDAYCNVCRINNYFHFDLIQNPKEQKCIDCEYKDNPNICMHDNEEITSYKPCLNYKPKQQIYKTPDNVKDYINRCDDAILKGRNMTKEESKEYEKILEELYKPYGKNFFNELKEKTTNVNLDDIAIAEVKHEKQSKLDEARNYKYASGEGWCSYQTMEYDIENIKQLYEQAIQELQCQAVDDPNEVGKLKQYNENLLNDKLYYKKKYDKLKVVKNQKIKVDEDIYSQVVFMSNLKDTRKYLNGDADRKIWERLLSIIDKKEE